MEIKGRIIEILPLKTGQSANGEWRKQEFILETESNYPKKICFMAWGEKIDEFAIKQSETLKVSVDLESREYNGRWYTDVKAWKIARYGLGDDNSFEGSNINYGYNSAEIGPLNNDDDIPF